MGSVKYETLRQELQNYYWSPALTDRARQFAQDVFETLDHTDVTNMTVMEQKLLQHKVILEKFEPVLFRSVPFFFESGVLVAHSDGAKSAKNHDFQQANAWVYEHNKHIFIDQDPALWELSTAQRQEQLYLICGAYNDDNQHFNYDMRPVLQGGLKSVYEKARAAMENADAEGLDFLKGVCQSMLDLKAAAEKFSAKAAQLAEAAETEADTAHYACIRDTAARIPWEKPETFYEALATLAFLRVFIGALDGSGPNTLGRLDLDLLPFYEADIAAGRLTKDGVYDLICKFLLVWDLHYDHDMAMVAYGDHELENTYVLGGCLEDGTPLWNDLTRMFLQATREESCIFPKITCRYSAASPKEYLDEVNKSVTSGTTTVLFENDDAMLPAILRAGYDKSDAWNYLITGCWGKTLPGAGRYDGGNYVNLLKPFTYAVHNSRDAIEKIGIPFETFAHAESFESLYRITVENCWKLIEERLRITREGGHVWHKVDALPIFSSTIASCITQKRDFTQCGEKYKGENMMFIGLPNIVDSLMAMKTLVFEEGICTLQEYLSAVQNNWDGAEELRQRAMACHGWGDGNDDSCALANRFNEDLYSIVDSLRSSWGGKVTMGHLTYTEIRWWAQNTLATPDGRRHGEYFSQGLTPSRLKRIPSVTSVIRSLQALDGSTMAGNAVVNIILPGHTPPEACEAFLRATASSALTCLQLNCTSREQLLDAQKHPENYPDLIVRVCGFSAKFTSLSPEWQQEVLTRNFYE